VNLELSARLAENQLVVAFRGQLDAIDAAPAVAAVTALKPLGQCLIIDLAALDFIDCFALRALLEMRNRVQLAGGDVLLAAPRAPVRRLLDLVGLSGVFSIHATAASAAAFRGAAPQQPAVLAALPGGQPR
jgi:anti-sigma B factor antagonist